MTRSTGLTARWLRGGAAYAGTSLVQRSVSLLILPIMLRAMTPAEYGQLALVTAVAAAAGIILSFGLEAAIVRAYFQLAAEPAERDRYLNTVGVFLLVVPVAAWAIGATVILGLAPPGMQVGGLLLALAAAAVNVPATVLALVLLRLEERLRAYVVVSWCSTATYAVLVLILVVGSDLAVVGALTASLLASLVLLLAGLRAARLRFTRRVSHRHLVAALAFGLPLLPHLLAHWGLNLSDRAILGMYVSREDLGIYSLGYQVASPISMLVVAINQAVTPQLSRSVAPGGDSHGITRMITSQVWIAAFAGMSVALLGPVAITLFLPTSYAGAVQVVGWVALGYVFFGWYTVPTNALSILQGNTRWIWVATVAAAIVNVGLNLAFVPRWGIIVAAIATAVGYGTLLVGVSLLAHLTHALTVRLETTRLVAGALIILVAYVVTVAVTGYATLIDAAVRISVTLGVGAILLGFAAGMRPHLSTRRRVHG
jgi:O-antigen/teichoic acid export membrane protein